MTVTIVPRSTRFARNVQCGVASSRQSCLHRVKVAFHNPTVAARINAICTRMTLTVRSTNHNYKIDAEASALAKTPARPLGLQLYLPPVSKRRSTYPHRKASPLVSATASARAASGHRKPRAHVQVVNEAESEEKYETNPTPAHYRVQHNDFNTLGISAYSRRNTSPLRHQSPARMQVA
jgi:hypothetical protein